MFTGNRGCVVDDRGRVVRHHGNNLLWITCRLEFRGRRVELARPNRWTPLFFLDDAVALAAGHRPCGECRHTDYLAYRDGVTAATGSGPPLRAAELNRRLADERLRHGRGLSRAADRILWRAPIDRLPDATVVLDAAGRPSLLVGETLRPFSLDGWGAAVPVPDGPVTVLTPPTSVGALAHSFVPVLHPSAHALGRPPAGVASRQDSEV